MPAMTKGREAWGKNNPREPKGCSSPFPLSSGVAMMWITDRTKTMSSMTPRSLTTGGHPDGRTQPVTKGRTTIPRQSCFNALIMMTS